MGRFLTDLELMILLAVMRVGQEAYGVTIAREIRDTAKRDVALAVVYATLGRLEGRALVTSTLGPITAERGGRAKKFFEVTAQGVRETRAARHALTALWHGVVNTRPGTA